MGKKPLFAALLLTATLGLSLTLHSPRYDLTRVDPQLRSLTMPFQSVNLVNWSDGSIGMRILDRSGHQLRLALPASSPSGKFTYRQLFVNAERSDDPGAVEVAFSDDTRRLLRGIL